MSLPLSHIQEFPKVELHRHIDGSVPQHVLRRVLIKKGMQEMRLRTGKIISVGDEKAFDSWYRIGGNKEVADMLAVFDMVLTAMQDPEGIEEITYEVVLELARENIKYAELTCAPAYHTRGGLQYAEVFNSFLKGIRRGYKDSGVRTKLILGIAREAHKKEKQEDQNDPYGTTLVAAALKCRARNSEIAAIGLVCDEHLHPPEIYKEAFAMTFGTSLHRALHAGEMGTSRQREKNVWTALQMLRAHRIGHGIPVGASEDLMAECKRKCVGVECNPWSNMLLGSISSPRDLHIDRLYGNGVCFSVNSDDPVLLRKSLSENIDLVCSMYAWDEKQLIVMTRNALQSAFLDHDEYGELCTEFSRRAGTRIC